MSWIIDAGHGGKDSGAVANGIKEKDWTLEGAKYIHTRLNELGIKADLTRDKDVTLDQKPRTDKVKKYKKAISCHFNAGGGNGFEAIHSIHADGKFEHALVEIVRGEGFPVRPRAVFTRQYPNKPTWDYYYMHRETGKCRVTIVEFDFLDGPNINRLKDKKYREKLYECVVKAICDEENKIYKPVNAPKPQPKPQQPKKEEVFYRVVTGSYKDRANAEKRITELKKAGFDSFIDIFEK